MLAANTLNVKRRKRKKRSQKNQRENNVKIRKSRLRVTTLNTQNVLQKELKNGRTMIQEMSRKKKSATPRIAKNACQIMSSVKTKEMTVSTRGIIGEHVMKKLKDELIAEDQRI
jgi:hypothetical protein